MTSNETLGVILSLEVEYVEPEWDRIRTGERGEDEYWNRVELRDGFGQVIGEVEDYKELDVVWSAMADDVEASSFSLPGSSRWMPFVMQANRRVILIRIETYRQNTLIKKWTGRVDRAVRTKNGPSSEVFVELISDKAWLKYIVAWSAPFSFLNFQAPKVEQKYGKAISVMKHFILDNLIRIQSGYSKLGMLSASNRLVASPNNWRDVQDYMWPVAVTPMNKAADTSPTVVLQARMTPIADLISEVCKDYNLLPTVEFRVPGRDPAPAGITFSKPGVFIDIVDKDKERSRSAPGTWLGNLGADALVFIRGLFGRYDTPTEPDMKTVEGMKSYFGDQADDPWVIFRDSDEHWSEVEVTAYAPTATRTISGGSSPDFLNNGISLVANSLISAALASVGLGFVAGLGQLLTGKLEDLLFAYQDANDKGMRDTLGPYTFFEESTGQGTTAYTFDSAQQLRQARHAAIGYETATFTGGVQAFKPFRVFEDFDLLDPLAWEDSVQDKLITERLKQVSMKESRSDGVSFEVRLGEADRPEEPWSVQMRRDAMFRQGLNQALAIS